MKLTRVVMPNDPNTKYQSDLEFFNYHEFLAHDYEAPKRSGPVVVNHFPNPHVPKELLLYSSTRVIRIPRIFDSNPLSYSVPQFSTYTPGAEPAAIVATGVYDFDPVGKLDDTVFGVTSVTPLVPSYLSSEELREIVNTVNEFLEKAFSASWAENIIDILSATLYSKLFPTQCQRVLKVLDEYLGDVNARLAKVHPDLRVFSPAECAFLTLDIQIPKPTSLKESAELSLDVTLA